MRLRVSAAIDLVVVFEARLLGDEDETLACAHGSTMRSTEAMARMLNTEYALRARSIEVSGQPVPRFRAAVVDERGRWMHLAYGTTPEQARAQAEFRLADADAAAVVH